MAIDLRKLIKNQVHFGHQTSRWNPKMAPYIWGQKNNIHLIDVSKTAHQLEKAAAFLKSLAAEGKSILWVGTKKAAQEIIGRTAQELGNPYVIHRWVGGTFSNYRQVRKSIANLLNYEDILSKSEQFPYSKKELNLYQKRADRLEKNVGGIRMLAWPVGAVVIVDVKKEHVAVKEALTMGIPVVAIVDTNSDPSDIAFPIPGNDDAPRSISVLIEHVAQAVKQGQEAAAAKPQTELSSAELYESLLEEPGLSEAEEEEENEKRRKAQGARAPKKGGTALRPKPGTGRRPVPQAESGAGERRSTAPVSRQPHDVASTDGTIQTPALETKAQRIVKQEPTIQHLSVETKTDSVVFDEGTTIQTPATEAGQKKK